MASKPSDAIKNPSQPAIGLLTSLPAELICLAASFLNLSDLLNLSHCCRTLHGHTVFYVYRKFAPRSRTSCKSFLFQILHRPELARYVKELDLFALKRSEGPDNERRPALTSEENDCFTEAVRRFNLPFDGDWIRSLRMGETNGLTTLLITQLPALEIIRYPFLRQSHRPFCSLGKFIQSSYSPTNMQNPDRHWRNLKTLEVAPWLHSFEYENGPLFMDLLSLPTLRTFVCWHGNVFLTERCRHLKLSSLNITTLIFRGSAVLPEAFEVMVRACKTLKKFAFTTKPSFSATWRTVCPRQLCDSLSHHRTTITDLQFRINRGTHPYDLVEKDSNKIASLREFTALKRLDLSSEAISLPQPTETEAQRMQRLAKLFPSGLEKLALGFNDDRVPTAVADLVRNGAVAFPGLKSLQLYANRVGGVLKGMGDVDLNRVTLCDAKGDIERASKVAGIEQAIKGSGIELSFDCKLFRRPWGLWNET